MRWILLDVVLAVLALGLLALVGLRLWRQVRALGHAVGAAGEQVGLITDQLAAVQLDGTGGRPRPAPRATPAGHVSRASRTPRGVGSSRTP